MLYCKRMPQILLIRCWGVMLFKLKDLFVKNVVFQHLIVFSFVRTWVLCFMRTYSFVFCYYLSFLILSKYEVFLRWKLSFCHNLSFWDLSKQNNNKGIYCLLPWRPPAGQSLPVSSGQSSSPGSPWAVHDQVCLRSAVAK